MDLKKTPIHPKEKILAILTVCSWNWYDDGKYATLHREQLYIFAMTCSMAYAFVGSDRTKENNYLTKGNSNTE